MQRLPLVNLQINSITEIRITALNLIELSGWTTDSICLREDSSVWYVILKSWTIFCPLFSHFLLSIHRNVSRYYCNFITVLLPQAAALPLFPLSVCSKFYRSTERGGVYQDVCYEVLAQPNLPLENEDENY